MYGVGERLAGVGEFGFAVMSICTHRVFSSQPAFSIGAPPGFDVKHVTTGVSPSEIAATDCCTAPPLGQYSRRSRWFDAVRRVEGVRDRVARRCVDVSGVVVARVGPGEAHDGCAGAAAPALAPFVIVFALETSLAK